MGVKWLLRWKRLSVTEDDGGRTSDEDLLAAVVEQLACKAPRDTKTAKMEVKCYMLKQQPASATTTPAPGTTPQGMRDLWLVQSNDATDTCYLVDRQQNAVIEADNGMLTLVEKKLEYRIKTCVTFTGKRYTKGDFGLRIASATLTNLGSSGNVNLLGHVAELEYLPLSDPATAAGMLGAFLELMRAQIPRSTAGKPLGMFERPRDHTERYQHLPSTFSHQHTAVLYVDLSLTLCVHKSQQQQQLQQLRLQQQQIQQQQQQQQQPVGMAR